MVALLVVAGSLALCARAAAQNPPPTVPDEEPADTVKPPAADTRPPAAEAKPPEATPKRSPRPGDVQKVFVIKNVHVRPLAEVLAVFPATITFSTYQRSQALGVSAPPAVLAAIEETIKRLDVPKPPARNIELTGEILEALPAPAEPTSLPSELQGVVAQLKRTFSFAAYRLADTLFVRAREEQGLETNGTSATDFVGLGRLNYSLHVRTAFITAAAGGAVVHLDGMRFTALNPKLARGMVGVSGDIDIREGQRVVVGNSGLGTSGSAIILVLSAKVVD
jgi:hypothetical protein